jgi:Protein of unknown function, DUF481
MFRLALVATALAVSTPAFADDPKFEYGKAADVKEVKEVEWHASAEAGAIFTTGNSETTTATGGIHASRKAKGNKFTIDGSFAYAKSGIRVIDDLNGNGLIDGPQEITTQETITAETFTTKARYDRYLTESNSLFAAAVVSKDVPAGKNLVLEAQGGYSRELYKTKATLATAEIGYDYQHVDLVTSPSLSIHSLRGFAGFKQNMTEGVDFEASAEVLSNLNTLTLATMQSGGPFEDTRVNTHLAIIAKVGKDLAFQTAFDTKFDNRPAPLAIKGATFAPGFVPAAEKLDTILKVSLIYNFF